MQLSPVQSRMSASLWNRKIKNYVNHEQATNAGILQQKANQQRNLFSPSKFLKKNSQGKHLLIKTEFRF